MAENENTGSAIDRLTYLLIGAGIGATIALLFAPKSGRELRGDIADVSRRGVDLTTENARRLSSKATDIYGQTTQKAQELYGSTQHKAADLLEAGKAAVAAKREQISAAIEAGKEAYVDEKKRLASGEEAADAKGNA